MNVFWKEQIYNLQAIRYFRVPFQQQVVYIFLKSGNISVITLLHVGRYISLVVSCAISFAGDISVITCWQIYNLQASLFFSIPFQQVGDIFILANISVFTLLHVGRYIIFKLLGSLPCHLSRRRDFNYNVITCPQISNYQATLFFSVSFQYLTIYFPNSQYFSYHFILCGQIYNLQATLFFRIPFQ